MTRLTHRLDGMPILLAALTAYTALAAVTMVLLSLTGDARSAGIALALAADAALLQWRDQRAWFLQVAGCTALLVASAVAGGQLVVAETMILAVLALPATRSYYGVRGPLAA